MPGTAHPSTTPTWRATRARFAWHLANIGPLQCLKGPGLIHPGDNWHLGHNIDHVLGGTTNPNNLWPEHATATPGCCQGNTNNGARLGNHLRNLRRHGTDTTPSRDW